MALVDVLMSRLTRLQERVPMQDPITVGACDACQRDMGNCWLPTRPKDPPILWRQRFSKSRGAISISDLEPTGVIAHKDILAYSMDVREQTHWRVASDNRAAVLWLTKGSAISVAAHAYLLQ
jgi:hypothetical protein